MLAIGLAALTLGLSFGQEWGWLSAGTLATLGISIVMLSVAVYVETHIEHPILNLGLVSNRVFALANISFMLCMMALFAPGFLLPFYFEQLRGFSIVQTGLMMTPLPLMLAVVAPLSGSLADRLGSRWLSPPRNAQGEASGLLATGRVIGQSMSVALTGTVFAALGGATAGTLLSSPQAQSHLLTSISGLQNTFVSSFHAALLVCAVFAAFGVFTALARGNEVAAKKVK